MGSFVEFIIKYIEINPIVAALLGILSSINFCQLQANVHSSLYISSFNVKDVFKKSLFFILGRGVAFIVLFAFIYFNINKLVTTSKLNTILSYIYALLIFSFGLICLLQKCSKKINLKPWANIYEKNFTAFALGFFSTFFFCQFSSFVYLGIIFSLNILSYKTIYLIIIYGIFSSFSTIAMAFLFYFLFLLIKLVKKQAASDTLKKKITAVFFLITALLLFINFFRK